MKLSKICNTLYLITLILLFLPAFAFPFGSRTFRIYFIALLSFWGLFISLNFKHFISKLIYLFNKTPFKYLIYLLTYLFISSCIILLFKPIVGKHSLIYLLQLSFLYIIPSYLLSAYFISNEERLKKYIKFYFAALCLVFAFGLIEFIIGKMLHVGFVNLIQQFLANERYYSGNSTDQ